MKRFFALLLCLALCLPCLTAFAEGDAEPVFRTGDYEYCIREDGTAEILWYSGAEEKLVLPDKLDGLTVSSIGSGAFILNSRLTEITIPDSVTTIGEDVFKFCPKLTLTVGRDSCAERYCQENGLAYIFAEDR